MLKEINDAVRFTVELASFFLIILVGLSNHSLILRLLIEVVIPLFLIIFGRNTWRLNRPNDFRNHIVSARKPSHLEALPF